MSLCVMIEFWPERKEYKCEYCKIPPKYIINVMGETKKQLLCRRHFAYAIDMLMNKSQT